MRVQLLHAQWFNLEIREIDRGQTAIPKIVRELLAVGSGDEIVIETKKRCLDQAKKRFEGRDHAVKAAHEPRARVDLSPPS